jgi:hypothetical protein
MPKLAKLLLSISMITVLFSSIVVAGDSAVRLKTKAALFSPRRDVAPLIVNAGNCRTTSCPTSNCDRDCAAGQTCRTSCDANGNGVCDCQNR